MKFRFCGDGDCPDWVLAEINALSKLSSVKIKALAQIVALGILKPPLEYEKAEKLFSDSKLDADVNLKACIACISFILTSVVKYGCDSGAMHTELQQLGLPREHSSSIKRVVDQHYDDLTMEFKSKSLRFNPLEACDIDADKENNCAILKLKIGTELKEVTMVPHTMRVMLKDLKLVKERMAQLNEIQ